IVLPTTQYTLQRRTTHRPVNLSVWRFLIQTCKIGQYVKCRVAAAHHQDAFPCITRAMTASHIRHAIEDVIPDSAFAERWDTGCTKRVRCADRAGGVDHRLRSHFAFLDAIHVANDERHIVAPRVPHPIPPLFAYLNDASIEADVRSQFRRSSQRREVTINDFLACWEEIGVGGLPTMYRENFRRAFVHVVFPRREHTHVRPLAYPSANRSAGFQHQWCEATANQVHCSCQTNWAGTDHNDGQRRMIHDNLHIKTVSVESPHRQRSGSRG